MCSTSSISWFSSLLVFSHALIPIARFAYSWFLLHTSLTSAERNSTESAHDVYPHFFFPLQTYVTSVCLMLNLVCVNGRSSYLAQTPTSAPLMTSLPCKHTLKTHCTVRHMQYFCSLCVPGEYPIRAELVKWRGKKERKKGGRFNSITPGNSPIPLICSVFLHM